MSSPGASTPVAASGGAPPPSLLWDGPVEEATLVFVDLEMTGLDPTVDRVIELCFDRGTLGGTQKRLTSLVRPDDGRHGNEAIHGISVAMLAEAPPFSSLAPEVSSMLSGAVLCTHGGRLDIEFLAREFERVGLKVPITHYLDTLTLARRVFGFDKHNLGFLVTQLSLPAATAHRAAGDTDMLMALFSRLVLELRPTTLRDLWEVKVGQKRAREAVSAVFSEARAKEAPVLVRYRPSGKRPVLFTLIVQEVLNDLDPPRVLGYLLPGRGRKELRLDRVLSAEFVEV